MEVDYKKLSEHLMKEIDIKGRYNVQDDDRASATESRN